MNWEVELRNRQFRIKRALILASIGLVSGAVLFFNSETFPGVIYRSIGLAYFLGVTGFLSENLDPLKKALAGIMCIVTVILAFLILASPILCQEHARPGIIVGENSFTGEDEVIDFIGDPRCADTFPWYYNSVSKSEAEQAIEEHCSNTDSRACDLPKERRLEIAGYS